MDLSYPPEVEAFRAEVRAAIAAELPAGWKGLGAVEDRADAEALSLEWRQWLNDQRLLAVTWPEEYGGRGLPKIYHVVVVEELARVGLPYGHSTDTFGLKMLGNTLLRWGTEEQKKRFLPAILSREIVWCQGFSEPDAGSDLASLRTRAVLDGDDWVIDGQKIWTTAAHIAQWIFVLARTNPDAAKHRGISFLLCPLDQPGIEVRPIRHMSGTPEFNEVFFTGARTPAENVVGPVDDGWQVTQTLLGLERGEEAATNPILYRAECDRLFELARLTGRDKDPVVRQRLAWCRQRVEVMRYLGYRVLTSTVGGKQLGPEASMSKLFWSEYHKTSTELALDLQGVAGLVPEGRGPLRAYRTDDPGAPNSTGSWLTVFLNARAGTIYAGTSQVQRNIIAETVLGLPREAKG